MAEDLIGNQLIIESIEKTVDKGGEADNELIIKVLSHGGRSSTKMWRELGAGGRDSPAANMASTVEGLYFETALARRRPFHRKYVARINEAITAFVDENLSKPKREKIEREIKGQVEALYRSSGNER